MYTEKKGRSAQNSRLSATMKNLGEKQSQTERDSKKEKLHPIP